MVVSHNILAMNTCDQINMNNKKYRKTTEKLASGYKINRAADDAAGLSISEKMRHQIRNLNQATANTEDGISFIQTADGVLSEVHSILHRIEELAVQAANDTCAEEDRACIDDEIQELKEEISDNLRKAEFNGKKIFSEPYIPEVNGMPYDYQVFTTDNGEYGGVTVNQIRYTWSELGSLSGKVVMDADGTFIGGKYSFTDYTGEELIFETNAGDTPPNISRDYHWEAKDDGIYVNNNLASTWADMRITDSGAEDTLCRFEYKGMKIRFNVPEDATKQDIIDTINDADFNSYTCWGATLPSTTTESAVRLTNQKNKIYIYDDWKDKVNATNNDLSLVADTDGLALYGKDINDNNVMLGKMAWSEFKSANGDNPIVDWGISNQDPANVESLISLDDNVVYTFYDNTTRYSFKFMLSDEASYEQTKDAFSVNISTEFDYDVRPVYKSNLGANISYKTLVKSGLSFDPYGKETFEASVRAHKDGDRVVFTYNAYDKEGKDTILELEASISYKKLTYLLELGYNPEANEEDNPYIYTVGIVSGTDDFSYDISLKALKLNIDKEALEKQAYDATYGEAKRNNQPLDDTVESAYKTMYNSLYITERDKQVDDAISKMSASNEFRLKEQPSIKTKLTLAPNYSQHTVFGGVEIKPPEKFMYIQDGAYEDEDTRIQWKCLNLNTVGIGGAATKNRSEAISTIGQVKKSIRNVSEERSRFGAYQNRLSHKIDANNNYSENLQEAESKIRDTDIAEEMLNHSRQNILMQVGQSMLAQANNYSEGVLSLLQ